MKQKEDARVIRTKNKLFTSFKELLSIKTFEEITINEICLRSDVRRATFYKHFSDKYDFLRYFVSKKREDFDQRMNYSKMAFASADYYLEYVRSVVRFLSENEKIISKALNSAILSAIVEIVKEQNYKDTKERLEASVRAGMKLPASVEVVSMMLTAGIAHTLVKWYASNDGISEDEIAKEISSVVKVILS
jgi:AcrR family transcriptional regulator